MTDIGTFDEGPFQTELPPATTPETGYASEVEKRLAGVSSRTTSLGGRDVAGLTEASPVQIKTAAEYEALPSGTYFISPEGQKMRKPWYVTDNASYDAVPEGEIMVTPEGKRRKPKFDDLPYGVQTLYNMAINDKERLRILEQAYPGKVKADSRGELYVQDGDVRRKARGFEKSPGAYLTAQAAPVVASVLGEMAGSQLGHRVVPFVGGMIGGVAGGGAGGVGGQLFNDTVLQIAGVYDRTAAEQTGNLAEAGIWSAGGSAAGRILFPMAGGLTKWAKSAAPGWLARRLGTDKEAIDMGVHLADQGVKVPPSTVFKEAPHLHNVVEVLDPAFRTQKVLETSMREHYEQSGRALLDDLGVDAPGSLLQPRAAVPMAEAGAAAQKRMMAESQAADRALADRVSAQTAAATADDIRIRYNEFDARRALQDSQVAAQRLIDDGYVQIQREVDDAMRAVGADVNSGELWKQVAEKLRTLRQAVVERHRTWYQQATRMAGDEHPELGNLPELATRYLAQLPEGFAKRYPDIIKGIEDLANGNANWGQLHNLRSQIRSDVDWFTFQRSIDDGANIFFSKALDDVLHNPNATGRLALASQMLRATDDSYARNMAIWNDQRLNAVAKGIRSGQPADPAELFDTIVRSGRSDLTRWVAQQVGPNLWNAVRAADMDEILKASRSLVPGEIDGAKFINEVLKRHRADMLEAVHGPNATRLMEQAQRIAINSGDIPVTVRPGDTISEIVQRTEAMAARVKDLAAQRPMDVLQEEIKRMTREHAVRMRQTRAADPLGFLQQPSLGATAAAERILASEDTILAAAARFGEKSTEFEMLRRVYAERMLREGLDPAAQLSTISPAAQEILFPGVTRSQMGMLAAEMEFLLGARAARTGTGKGILATTAVEHPQGQLPKGAVGTLASLPLAGVPLRAMVTAYTQFVTWASTHPAFLRAMQRGLSADPATQFTWRNMLKTMAYGQGANRGGAMGAGVGAGQASVPPDTTYVDPDNIAGSVR